MHHIKTEFFSKYQCCTVNDADMLNYAIFMEFLNNRLFFISLIFPSFVGDVPIIGTPELSLNCICVCVYMYRPTCIYIDYLVVT